MSHVPSLAIEIKAIALDVDGVLTDGGVWWGPNGEEWKRFSFADIMGVSLARKAGLVVALISGEDSPLVDRFAVKMSIVHVEKNCKDKAAAIRRFSAQADVPLSQICFMGDDVNDLGAIQLAGFAAAPADARPAVLKAVSFVATKNGGQGAVRELVDFLLAENISKHTPKLEPNLS
ncbi:MAG TPA: HAD hydrolase family protein [Bryobacteraceae bacterium]|jgi:3-deoxy-D-manno-octulosonate 8-phosphate phosphatase (KDO 8-P phosphatase)